MDYRLKIPASCSNLSLLIPLIPRGTTHLDLSHNDLNRFLAQDLIVFFNSLPKHIHSLNLSHNHFGPFKSPEELAHIIAALPRSLTKLDLSHNELGTKSVKHLHFIFDKLPLKLLHLQLEQNGYSADIDSYSTALQHCVAKHLQVMQDKPELMFCPVTTPEPIYDYLLPFILAALEEDNTELASLTAGLLLDGKMTICSKQKLSQDAIDLLAQCRCVLAIDYYLKSDPDCNRSASFVLWHLKTTSKLPEIQTKLASKTIQPPGFFKFGELLSTFPPLPTPISTCAT